MEAGTGMAIAKSAASTAEFTGKAWGFFKRWRRGDLRITHPENRSITKEELVSIEGTHHKAKGHFWMLTSVGDEYWIQWPVILHPDGKWEGKISVGGRSGPRKSIVLLVWTSEFANALFSDIKDRSHRAKHHGPIRIPWDESQVSIVESRVLHVELPPQPPAIPDVA